MKYELNTWYPGTRKKANEVFDRNWHLIGANSVEWQNGQFRLIGKKNNQKNKKKKKKY